MCLEETSIYKKLKAVFEKCGINPILVGGFAVNRYGYSRFTHDIDFMIEASAYLSLEAEMKKIGYREVLRTGLFVRMKGASDRELMVDFLFVNPATFKKLHRNGDTVTIDSNVFSVPSLFHLIAMKLHSIKNSRKRRFTTDMTDIIKLIERNDINVLDDAFKTMCLKFGNENLYNQIVDVGKNP
ncbi:MAG: hypothetical protein GF350_00795 [Chitinivibrionales bacterium]|nr:hypothetical protein [Chitinivibrionales bacterium]